MKLVKNTWGWSPRGIWWWMRWGWAWPYQTWGIVSHDWKWEERRAKLGPICWSLGHIPYYGDGSGRVVKIASGVCVCAGLASGSASFCHVHSCGVGSAESTK